MKRIKEEFLNEVEKEITLSGKNILEIGCGNGSRSAQIANRCRYLVALDPAPELIALANQHNHVGNIEYVLGKAENLVFPNKQFDAVVFTLSLHHVPIEKMSKAIDEAVRVTKKDGYIIFLEPTEEGTFFEAEIAFDACDGDERANKRTAYQALKNYRGYQNIVEQSDETIFQFDSFEDFVTTLKPKKNISKIKDFLEKNGFVLRASRRINIFKV